MRNHVERALVQYDEQSVGGAPRQHGFIRATRLAKLGCIDSGDADLAIAELEGVAIDHARDSTTRSTWGEGRSNHFAFGERAKWRNQRGIEHGASQEQ